MSETNYKGIVMKDLIILRERLVSLGTTKVEAAFLNEVISMVHENLTDRKDIVA